MECRVFRLNLMEYFVKKPRICCEILLLDLFIALFIESEIELDNVLQRLSAENGMQNSSFVTNGYQHFMLILLLTSELLR